MVKSEDVKAKANEAIREINRKVHRLIKLVLMPHPITEKRANEARRLLEEITRYLNALDDIIIKLLEGKELLACS